MYIYPLNISLTVLILGINLSIFKRKKLSNTKFDCEVSKIYLKNIPSKIR
jgi:hypothetical protein